MEVVFPSSERMETTAQNFIRSYVRVIPVLELPLKCSGVLKFSLTQEFTQAVNSSGNLTNVVVMSVLGSGRAGKSTFLNAVLECLVESESLVVPREHNPLSHPYQTASSSYFRTSNSYNVVTKGIDAVVLDLVNHKVLILIDTEGLNNDESPGLDALLAFLSRISQHLVFLERQLGDCFENSIGRLISAGITLKNENKKIDVILNQSYLKFDVKTLEQRHGPHFNSAWILPDAGRLGDFQNYQGRTFLSSTAQAYLEGVNMYLQEKKLLELPFCTALCHEGCQVTLVGLVKFPELNGKFGVICRAADENSRFQVSVDIEGRQELKSCHRRYIQFENVPHTVATFLELCEKTCDQVTQKAGEGFFKTMVAPLNLQGVFLRNIEQEAETLVVQCKQEGGNFCDNISAASSPSEISRFFSDLEERVLTRFNQRTACYTEVCDIEPMKSRIRTTVQTEAKSAEEKLKKEAQDSQKMKLVVGGLSTIATGIGLAIVATCQMHS